MVQETSFGAYFGGIHRSNFRRRTDLWYTQSYSGYPGYPGNKKTQKTFLWEVPKKWIIWYKSIYLQHIWGSSNRSNLRRRTDLWYIQPYLGYPGYHCIQKTQKKLFLYDGYGTPGWHRGRVWVSGQLNPPFGIILASNRQFS